MRLTNQASLRRRGLQNLVPILIILWVVTILSVGLLTPTTGSAFILGVFVALILLLLGLVEPRWLIVFYAFWLGAGHDASRIWTDLGLPLGSATRAVGILIVVLWPLYRVRTARQRRLLDFPASMLWLIPFVIALIVASQLNNEPIVVFGVSLETVLLGPVTYLMLVDLIDSPAWLRRVIYALAAQQVLQAGLVLYVMQGGAVPELLQGNTFSNMRAAGTALDPNLLAMYMLTLAALGLALLTLGGALRSQVFGILLAGLATVAIVLSFSRSGVLSLAAMVAAGAMFRRKDLFLYISLLIFATVAILSINAVVSGWLPSALALREYTIYYDADRLVVWRAYLETLITQPLGLGLNAGFHPQIVRQMWAQYGLLGLAPHNLLLDVWADLGLQGLIPFLALLVVSVKAALSCRRLVRENPGRREVETAFVILCLIGFGVSFIFYHGYYLKMLWLVLALPVCLERILLREFQPAEGALGRNREPVEPPSSLYG
jgi:O-antigen ligase